VDLGTNATQEFMYNNHIYYSASWSGFSSYRLFKMYFAHTALAAFLLAFFASPQATAADLRACLDPLPINGINFPLEHGVRNGAFIECE
jgi:hypothetical protein